MRLGARASDWHSGNPNVKPGLWLGAVFGGFVVCVILIGLAGRLVNGDGSPFLS
jgi:hypothetical protein